MEFNVRRAGEGCDDAQWGTMVALKKKDEDSDESEEEDDDEDKQDDDAEKKAKKKSGKQVNIFFDDHQFACNVLHFIALL